MGGWVDGWTKILYFFGEVCDSLFSCFVGSFSLVGSGRGRRGVEEGGIYEREGGGSAERSLYV